MNKPNEVLPTGKFGVLNEFNNATRVRPSRDLAAGNQEVAILQWEMPKPKSDRELDIGNQRSALDIKGIFMKQTYTSGTVLAAMLMVVGCQAQQPPTQVIYRFDDHRYLELKGWDCEGELWYTDTQRGIHTEPVSQFYRIFTKKFIHPSDRYTLPRN